MTATHQWGFLIGAHKKFILGKEALRSRQVFNPGNFKDQISKTIKRQLQLETLNFKISWFSFLLKLSSSKWTVFIMQDFCSEMG